VIIHLKRWGAPLLLLASTLLPCAAPGALADEPAASEMTAAAPSTALPDFATLKTLPLIAVIETGTGRYTAALPDAGAFPSPARDDKRARALAQIDGLAPELRRLVWLTWLLECWGWSAEGGEGLHSFFYLGGGDDAFAVRDALFEAGLLRQHDVFRQAMAAFGPRYPADQETRAPFFTSGEPAPRIDATRATPRPLNAFDAKIMALGAAFGSRQSYERAIERFVAAKPMLAAWTTMLRTEMPDDERLQWLAERLIETDPVEGAEIAGWPKAYRQVFLLNLFNGEVLNGGMHQFFFNGSGDFAPQIARTLREAGLPTDAERVEKGMAMFPAPYPVDLGARRRYFSRDGMKTTDWDKRLDALTATVDDGAIEAAMLAIAKREGVLPR
jgi:hypothetical protein